MKKKVSNFSVQVYCYPLNMSINFIYQNKIYEINLNLFNNFSNFFLINENKTKNINLFTEFENCFGFSDEIVNEFIHFFQNEEININFSNVMQLHYLSQKYHVIKLTTKTEKFINSNYKELVNKFLTNITQKNIQISNPSQYEEIISNHISEFLSDKRLMMLPMQNICRVLGLISRNFKIQDQKNEIIEREIIDFLFEYVKHQGIRNSFLFSSFEIGKANQEYFFKKYIQESDNVDMHMFEPKLFQSLYFILEKKKDAETKLLQEIDRLNSQLEYQKDQFQQQISDNFKKIVEISVKRNPKKIDKQQFQNYRIEEITIPDGVEIIDEDAFNNCSLLKNVIFPSSLSLIKNGAFNQCVLLTQLNFPSSLESIDSFAFSGCISLLELNIPSSVKSIGSNAFSNCTSLTKVLIPSSVSFFGSNVFDNCIKLEEVTMDPYQTQISNSIFQNCPSLHSLLIQTIESSTNSINISIIKKFKTIKIRLLL